MEEQETKSAVEAGRFYDVIRRSGLSSAALAHGEAYIGQECLLTPEEIADFARRAGITAATAVLDSGSGTGGPACYLAQRLGCRVLGRDRLCTLWHFPGLETPQSYVEALQAAGFRLLYHAATSAYAVRFYSRLLEQYVERRAEFEAARGPARYQEGLERLRLSQQLASAGRLGQFACIAEQPAPGAVC
jgi:hypothetical protein